MIKQWIPQICGRVDRRTGNMILYRPGLPGMLSVSGKYIYETLFDNLARSAIEGPTHEN